MKRSAIFWKKAPINMVKIDDIRTVYWKERCEFVAAQRDKKVGWMTPLVLVVVVGGILPYQLRSTWTTSGASILVGMWVMFFRVTNAMADSIVGERERHTLEALVITPLPRYAIVWGKMLAAITNTAWSMLLAMIVALVVSNAPTFHPWHNYSLIVLVGIMVDGALAALFAAGIGVTISVYSSTTRQAQQILSSVALLLMLMPLGLQTVAHVSFTSWLTSHHLTQLILDGSVVLILGVGIMVVIAQRSFQHLLRMR